MRELSLNILDIAQNSITANAKLVKISIIVETFKNRLTIKIEDNGKGMSKEFLKEVTDPFKTTRTTRKVGFGLPFFKMAAEMSNGTFSISSELNVGTTVVATFELDNIDRMPLGNIAETALTLLSGNPQVDFEFYFKKDDNDALINSKDIKSAMGDLSFEVPEVSQFVKSFIEENINATIGGSL